MGRFRAASRDRLPLPRPSRKSPVERARAISHSPTPSAFRLALLRRNYFTRPLLRGDLFLTLQPNCCVGVHSLARPEGCGRSFRVDSGSAMAEGDGPDFHARPLECPGIDSNEAGKAEACQGCPNQNLCALGQVAGPDPAIEEIKEKMKTVKHKLLVLSGKGGVGKSTFTACLAHGLAEDETAQIAVLDIDICGPSIPKIMGLEGEQVHQSGSGWSPVYVEENLGVMSVGFLLSSPDDAVIWRGPKKNGMIKQFLRDVDWGEVDYLIVDTPPGTSDEHLSIVQFLSSARIDGAVIVTTPQEVALQDVRKEISFCRKVKLPIVGVVENMSGFICPKCKKQSEIFPPSTGGAEMMCHTLNVPLLGKVPLDPQIGKSCDTGQSFLSEAPNSPATLSYRSIIQSEFVVAFSFLWFLACFG